MKTLKSMLAGVVLLFVYATANAVGTPAANKLTKEDVVNIYIDAIAHGDIKGLDNVLDDNLQYNVERSGEVNQLHKDDLMAYLKSNPVDPTVTTFAVTVREDDGSAMVKVVFNYSTYTRTDMVTLDKTGDWMITKVVSTFS
jgi:Putative lumazine-binding